MRIAISGTHGSGKTTLLEDFITAHREFVHSFEWRHVFHGRGGRKQSLGGSGSVGMALLRELAHGVNVLSGSAKLEHIRSEGIEDATD